METWNYPDSQNSPKSSEITVFSEIETQLSFANAQNDPKSFSFWKKVSFLQKRREKVAVFLRKTKIIFSGKHDFALVYGLRTLKISKKITFEQAFLGGFHFSTF